MQIWYTLVVVGCLAIAIWVGRACAKFFQRPKDYAGAAACLLLVAFIIVCALLALRELSRSGLGLGIAINIVLPWTLVVLLIKEYFSLGFKFSDFVDKVREREEERKRSGR